jgi:dipeptidyl aminopeptidase/acylaminoacyl peptidase
MSSSKSLRFQAIGLIITLLVGATASFAGTKPLTWVDLMQFRQIEGPVLSKQGSWIAYSLRPDRGDSEVEVRRTDGSTVYGIELGSDPVISGDERWVAAKIQPTLEARLAAEEEDADDGPKTDLALLDLSDGSQERIERVESFLFSKDGRFLAYKLFEEEDDETATGDETSIEPEEVAPESELENEPGEKAEAEEEEDKKKLGATVHLRDLASGQEAELPYVTEFSFDEPTTVFAYSVSAPNDDNADGHSDGVYIRHLDRPGDSEEVLAHQERGRYAHLQWVKDQSRLAFVEATLDDEAEPGDGTLWVWDGDGSRTVASKQDAPDGWTLPAVNELTWSRDGQRLFFGFKPVDPDKAEASDEVEGQDEEEEPAFEPYDIKGIVEDRGVDVWHWNDPLIIPNQKEEWDKEKDRTYKAVYHLGDGSIVPLADLAMRHVQPNDNPRVALAGADAPYLRERTWDGSFGDLYTVSLATGERTLIAERLEEDFKPNWTLSPKGGFVLYYDDGNYHLFDVESGERRNVTAALGVPFADEDHDYPSAPPGYGFSEWLADDSAIFVYDKYDIWRVPTDSSQPSSLTEGSGRQKELTFRIVDMDPEEDSIQPHSPLLLTGYHQKEKHDAFYTARPGSEGITPLLGTGRHLVHFVAQAEDADRILFTRERYDEYPDLWTTVPNLTAGSFGEPRKLSDANPQVADFAWGEADLVEWTTVDGIPLQGVLIKPGNYDPDKRYPVLIYYYRFFSQRLNEFNEPVINHRPSFPMYASNGYAVFLPDIRFEVGRPGASATKCLVPGVERIVEMGVADPEAIGLHGHSWSGYQTAFVVTQTDIFKAAVTGAPVSNMTSAYSGIRWGSGLARQFQYEKSQSRLGASLWEDLDLYLENSPVFFADRIETPLLIQFGDKDEAVPWYQGIELYLACRRLDKDCIFLQYRDEPHHLKKYPNKVDYSIKMMQFFDHHLKGSPAPTWMTEGVPYKGE